MLLAYPAPHEACDQRGSTSNQSRRQRKTVYRICGEFSSGTTG